MKVTLERKNDDFLLEAQNTKGFAVMMDNKSEGNPKGVSPMELLLMGLGGCSAMDIISILKKKRQTLTSYKVTVDSERNANEVPALFKSITVIVFLEGDITPEAALRAAELSFDKYCSVSKILEKSSPITHKIVLNGKPL